MVRKALIDTSVLIAFHKANMMEKLSILWTEIKIPNAVKAEFTKKGKASIMRSLLRKFFELCKVSDEWRVKWLIKDGLELGEAEVIVQATETEVDEVIIDEKKARRFAEHHGLRVIGSIGILGELEKVGIISDASMIVDKLRRMNIRLPPNQKV